MKNKHAFYLKIPRFVVLLSNNPAQNRFCINSNIICEAQIIQAPS